MSFKVKAKIWALKSTYVRSTIFQNESGYYGEGTSGNGNWNGGWVEGWMDDSLIALLKFVAYNKQLLSCT